VAANVGSINASLSTGNVSYSSVGFLPKALILWGANVTAHADQDNTAYGAFYGITDGSTAHCVSIASGESVADMAFGQDTSVVRLIDEAGTILAEAEIVSFDFDGFTLNWTTQAASGYIINFLAIGGGDLTDAKVGTFTITGTGDEVVTGVGFEPDAFVFLVADFTTLPTIVTTPRFNISVGLDSVASQTNTGIGFRTDAIDKSTGSSSGTDSIVTNDDQASPAADVVAQVTATGADGFTVTASAHASDARVGYLALQGDSLFVGTDVTPNSATTNPVTGVGFEPEAVLITGTLFGAGSAPASEAAILCVAAGDGTRQRMLVHGRDVGGSAGLAQKDDAVWQLPVDINAIDDISNEGNLASLQSLDSDGFTTDHTVAAFTENLRFLAINGGLTLSSFDNKLIYADGIQVV
jgi:hypothetical protein